MKTNNKIYYFIIVSTLVSLLLFLYSSNVSYKFNAMNYEILSKTKMVVDKEEFKDQSTLDTDADEPSKTITLNSKNNSGIPTDISPKPYEIAKSSSSLGNTFTKDHVLSASSIKQITSVVENKVAFRLDSIKKVINDNFEVTQNDLKVLNSGLSTLNASNNTIVTTLNEVDQKVDILINKVDSILNNKKINTATIEKIIDLNSITSSDNVLYRYTSFMHNNNRTKNDIKVNEHFNFNVDIYSQMLSSLNQRDKNLNNDQLNKKLEEKSDDVTGIVTTTPMVYAVVYFEPTLGKVYKSGRLIESDTILLSMVNANNILTKTFHSYTYLGSDTLIKSKSEVILNTHIKYYDESFARFPTYSSTSISLLVHPTNSIDYFLKKTQEFLIFGIDKIFYLCTTIVGLLVTIILTYIRKRLNIGELPVS